MTRLTENNVVYSKVKAFEGAITVVDGDGEGRFVSPEFPVFEMNDSVDPAYLRQWFASERFMTAIRSLSKGIGARRERVNPTGFLRIEVPVPSLPDQRRIAAHLDATSKVSSHVVASPVESVLTSIAQQLHDGPRVRLKDLVEQVSRPEKVVGAHSYKMAGVRWYGEGAFHRETLPGDELRASTVYRLEPGDLVYNRLFAWKQSFAIVNAEGLTVSNEFPAFAVNDEALDRDVLLALLLSDDFTAQVNGASTGSTPTSRNRLKVDEFLELTVPLPDHNAQRLLKQQIVSTQRLKTLARRRETIAQALLPAARNEVFSQLR